MLTQSTWARWRRMSCSSHRKVRLCGTFCRTCTTAVHVSFASRRWQLPHCLLPMTYSTTNDCCITAPDTTSFWMHTLILIRRLCGSVQMNPASTSFTLFKPLMRLMQNVSSSLDSRSARIQCFGGCRYRWHSLQYRTVHCFWTPSVMSTCETCVYFRETCREDASSVAANEGSRGVDSGGTRRERRTRSRARARSATANRTRKKVHARLRSRASGASLCRVFSAARRVSRFRRRVDAPASECSPRTSPPGWAGCPCRTCSIGRARGRVAAEPRTSWLRWPGVRGSLGTAATTAGRKRMACLEQMRSFAKKSYEGSLSQAVTTRNR